MYGGLEDKYGDWIEQPYQTGMRLEQSTSRMPKKYQSKQTTQLSIFWRQTNPYIERDNKRVISLKSRKRKVPIHTPILFMQNKTARKTVKLERRYGAVADTSLRDHVDNNFEEMEIKTMYSKKISSI